MIGARSTIKPNTAALAVATADWDRPEDNRGSLPRCLEVPEKMRSIWTSRDPDVKAAAKAECEDCPVRRSCLRMAVDSKASGGVYGGFNLDSPSEMRLALVWLGDIEATPRRRSPNRTKAAS